MEQVSFKNSPPVCENSLATEVVNQISNANFSMSSCRIKNGLVNGVADDVCTSNNNNTRARLMGKGDSVKPDMDISKDKHGQYKTQTCMENSTVFRKSVETSVTHSSDISSLTNEIGCSYMDPSTSKGKAKRKTKTKVNHDEHLKDVSDIDSTISKSSSETKPISLVNCDSAESNKSLVTDMRKLNLEHSVSDNSGDRVETVANMVVDVNAFQVSENFSAITFVQYESEEQMPLIMKIIQKDLSEPYSIYTYRYFIHNWPKLCFLAMCDNTCVGAIVCKLDYHRKATKRGYIAMLAVDQHYRNRQIGSTLVRRAIRQMIAGNADEVVLETEVTNKSALRLYELLGFVKDKRLFRYYLNGVDALRLKLWLR